MNLFCLSFALAFILSTQYSLKVTMGSQTTESISNYYQDMAACSCDLTINLCDNYCCCDTSCSAAIVSTWTSNYLCLTTSIGVEKYCSAESSGGLGSFEDLACVFFSNRGSIGNYYSYPTLINLDYPTPSLLQKYHYGSANQWTASKKLTDTLGPTSTSIYSSSNLLLKANYSGKVSNLLVLKPNSGSNCELGALNFNSSQTYTCRTSINSNNCATANGNSGTFSICLNGNCSLYSSSTFTVPNASINGTNCSLFVTSYSIALTLTSTGSEYIVSNNFSMSIVTASVALNSLQTVSVTIVVNAPSSFAGNPGYSLNSAISLSLVSSAFTISQISDSSNNCYTTGNYNASARLNINFGQNLVVSCVSGPVSCPSSLYVDSIAKNSQISLLKYGNSGVSSEVVPVQGVKTSVDTCSQETIVLNILYSDVGWQLDKQNYIIAASITTLPSPETTFNQKFFKVNWKYVAPAEIASPALNTFYTYFTYLWTPLKQKFGIS